jgi:type I restriction enzyme S subunit
VIDELKPYPEYVVSDVPWAPSLPKTWRTERAKWLFTKMERPVRPEDQVVTCFRDGMVTLRTNRRVRGFTEATVEHGYQGIRKGDLVIHQMDAFAGAIGVSDSDGKGTPVYSVCQPKIGINARYYAHTVRQMSQSQWILALAKGIRERSTDFRYEMFGNQKVPLPSEEEQGAIVRFLDGANVKVSRFILSKRKLVARLNEQKQAIVHRAVTLGLDFEAAGKLTGISWVDTIPEHWKVLRSKYLFREVDERSEEGKETHLSMSQKRGLIPNTELTSRRLLSDSYAGAKLCRQGDLVLNRLKAHLGVFALAPQAGLVSPDYTVLRPIRELDSRYFEALYRSPACRVELRRRAKGIVQGFWRLYTDDFYDIRVPVPPVAEQFRIMNYLDGALVQQNTAIARIEREIALIQEYRTRLVADIVTGKYDVREAVSKLSSDLTTDEGSLVGAAILDEETLDPESEDSDE